MKRQKINQINALKRKKRVRTKTQGTVDRPRLTVFRSNQHTYVQIINDATGKTLVAASEKELTKKPENKTDAARMIGTLIAKKAKDNKITKVAFDRGSYRYHGRVKAVAEAVREAGIKV